MLHSGMKWSCFICRGGFMKHFAAFAAKYEAVLRAMKRTFGTWSESLAASFTKNKSRPFGGFWFLVEVAGVEPASQRGMMKTSTCLFHLQSFFVIRFANGQAILQNRHSLISEELRMPEVPPRALDDATCTLAPGQAQRRGGKIMPPMRTLRSQLLF